jgi:hypothetical protein
MRRGTKGTKRGFGTLSPKGGESVAKGGTKGTHTINSVSPVSPGYAGRFWAL